MFLVQTSLPRSLCEFICKKSIYILPGVLRSFTTYTHALPDNRFEITDGGKQTAFQLRSVVRDCFIKQSN